MSYITITEDTDVVFQEYTQLSISIDKENGSLVLFVDDKVVGICEIWYDAEMDKREYITINNEVIYLDTLKTI